MSGSIIKAILLNVFFFHISEVALVRVCDQGGYLTKFIYYNSNWFSKCLVMKCLFNFIIFPFHGQILPIWKYLHTIKYNTCTRGHPFLFYQIFGKNLVVVWNGLWWLEYLLYTTKGNVSLRPKCGYIYYSREIRTCIMSGVENLILFQGDHQIITEKIFQLVTRHSHCWYLANLHDEI